MVIFFIVLLSVIGFVTLLITCSTLKIEVKEFILINTKIEKFNIVISLNLFNKIKWLRFKLDNKRVEKIKGSGKLNFLNKLLNTKILKKYKNAGQILRSDWRVVLKKLNKVEIEKINLESKIGTENAGATAIITGTISAILGILFSRKVLNPRYLIEPIYINRNYIYLSINCIIGVKLVHIIHSKEYVKV